MDYMNRNFQIASHSLSGHLRNKQTAIDSIKVVRLSKKFSVKPLEAIDKRIVYGGH